MLFFSAALAAPTVTSLPPLLGHPPTKLSVQVSFDPSGIRLVSWSEDGVRVWSAEEGQALRFIAGRTSHVVVRDRGQSALVGYRDRAALLDLDSGRVLRTFPTGWDWVENLAADPAGRWVVIGDDSKERVLRYDAATGARLTVPTELTTGHPRAFSPAGVLYWTDAQHRLHAWDPATGEAWSDERPGIVTRMDWSTDGAWLCVTAWTEGQAQPWQQGQVRVRGPSGIEHVLDETGYDVAISPHGELVAIARDSAVHLVDPATGQQVAVLEAPALISSVDWGADGLLAVGTVAGPIHRWRITP